MAARLLGLAADPFSCFARASSAADCFARRAANCTVGSPPELMAWRMLKVVAGHSTRTSAGIAPAAWGEADAELAEAEGDAAAVFIPISFQSARIAAVIGSANAAFTALRMALHTHTHR